MIAAVSDAAKFILRPLTEYYTRIYPGTEISILERGRDEAAAMIADRTADIAVTDVPLENYDITVFATVAVNGAAAPMRTYYLSRTADGDNHAVADDFLLCCKTFK